MYRWLSRYCPLKEISCQISGCKVTCCPTPRPPSRTAAVQIPIEQIEPALEDDVWRNKITFLTLDSTKGAGFYKGESFWNEVVTVDEWMTHWDHVGQVAGMSFSVWNESSSSLLLNHVLINNLFTGVKKNPQKLMLSIQCVSPILLSDTHSHYSAC